MRWEGVYPDDAIAQLCEIIHRANPNSRLKPAELRQSLLKAGFGHAPDATEFEIGFDYAALAQGRPSATAKSYRDLSNAKTTNGLISKFRRINRADPLIRTEIRAQCRHRSPKRQRLRTTPDQRAVLVGLRLPDDADLIREAAERLATFHGATTQLGRPADDHVNIALTRLATLFAKLVGVDDPLTLPYSETSRFVGFVVLATQPFEAFVHWRTAKAISERWRDLRIVRPKAPLETVESALKRSK